MAVSGQYAAQIAAPHPAPSAGATLTTIREGLLTEQGKLQEANAAARLTQRETETRQRRIQESFAAITRIIADQQGATTAADDAIKHANEAINSTKPKLKATLDDQVEAQLETDFNAVLSDGTKAQAAVDRARGELWKAQGEQATAQRAVDAQEVTVKQLRDALAALPAYQNTLAKDLKQQQAALETAFKAGDVRRAYVLLLELTATRDALDAARKPEYLQKLIDDYVDGVNVLETKRGELAVGQGEVAAKQTLLDDATTALQKFQAERAKRLQQIWGYQK